MPTAASCRLISRVGDDLPRDRFAIRIATTEAVGEPEIRSAFAEGTLDADIEAHLRMAREKGELRDDADPAALRVLAFATLHTIAIRASAGAPSAELREIVRKTASVICG